EHYLASKAQLFLALPPGGTAVLNAGDENAGLLAEVIPPGVRLLWFAGPGRAQDREVDLRVTSVHPGWSGLHMTLESRAPWSFPPELRSPNLAAVQAENLAAALLAAVALGVPPQQAAQALATCPPPPGRFEWVPGPDEGPRVVVDYAHAPEALRAALADARALQPRSLFLVIGAGGDADASKREPLGRAAAAADQVWLTSDNPRSEDPEAIAAAVRRGLPTGHPCRVVLDRAAAITEAIAAAGSGDLVLIAGKGHESQQVFADRTLPFSDREVAARALGRALTLRSDLAQI
ncbi:MAG: UDP-N-acetylmuramoyl-L-alanyl-D-glutamate--2,6-diaminopimelate ligase, partial [Myxococcales bacterium]|nr:UDP-N-acetylmuramoyl-L-alanyl-D-glutamate--2,6-diaminopimelate ligase [Myxococcales bacterium]